MLPTYTLTHQPIMKPTLLFLFSLLVSSAFSAISAASCHQSDLAALKTFRAGLTDPYIGVFASWKGSDCCSNWYGVSCDPTTGRVSDLSLRGESTDLILTAAGHSGLMTGKISPSVCSLTSLSTFILADWKQISGEIPACITTQLTSLHHLDLVGNQLSGNIPSNIGNLKLLTVLNLSDNKLWGNVPSSITALTDLRHLDLSGNQLSGEIPKNFGDLKMLSRALLNKNQISGSIPESITTMKRLADLDLSNNRLSGKIPEKFGEMLVLSTLNLDGNSLSGNIPASLVGSKGIGILNLSRNMLEGEIPDVFGQKTYFMMLDLSYNKLSGRVPKTLSSAMYVGHLDLSHNHLCGAIPTGMPFDHLEAASFASNDCLCGAPLASCKLGG